MVRLIAVCGLILLGLGVGSGFSGQLVSGSQNADEALRNLTTGQHAVANAGNAHPGTLRVIARLDRSDLTYAQGDTIHLVIETNEDSYVTVLNVGASGRTIQLFPNAFQPDNLVKANVPVEIPPPRSGARITVTAPFGAELVKVIASNKSIPLTSKSQLEAGGVFRSLTGPADAVIHQINSATAPANSERVAIMNQVIRTVERAPRRRRRRVRTRSPRATSRKTAAQ